jgi:hypothetical protein
MRIMNDTVNINFSTALKWGDPKITIICIIIVLTYNNMFGNSWRTYAIIFWWCWMHPFNLAYKSQFAILWTCSTFCSSWGVIWCYLTSNMAILAYRTDHKPQRSVWQPETSNRILFQVIGKLLNSASKCLQTNTTLMNVYSVHRALYKTTFCEDLCWLTAARLMCSFGCIVNSLPFECGIMFKFNWIGRIWTWKSGNLWTFYVFCVCTFTNTITLKSYEK